MPIDLPGNKVLWIVGPTAVGKTGVAIRLASQIGGEIVSADSRYLYKGMNIGTAKPTEEEMNQVTHHMIDIADPDETWSLGQYYSRSKEVIKDILSRGKTPIVVGGTGQYFRAFTQGWTLPGAGPEYELRELLEKWGNEIGYHELHRKLAMIDPEAAAFIQSENMRRTIRALEVIFTSGQKFSDLRQKTIPEFDFHVVGLTMNRENLYRRVDERIQKMFELGFVEEVKELVDKGFGANCPSMSAIGYNEVLQFLEGKTTLDGVIVEMKRKTRQFIRRQANWFKPNDENIRWYEMGVDVADRILKDYYY